MIYKNALRYIESAPASTDRDELALYLSLLETFGLLQGPRTILLTGSYGCRCTAHILTGILSEAGYRVGSLTAPREGEIADAIRINTRPIPPDKLTRYTERIAAELLSRHRQAHPEEKPSIKFPAPPFSRESLLALIARLWFADEQIDTALFACREAAVAALLAPAPLCLIFTPLAGTPVEAADHTVSAFLEKRHCEIVSAPQESEWHKFLFSRCAADGNRFTIAAKMAIEITDRRPSGTSFIYRARHYRTPLFTEEQLYAIATAVEAAYALRRTGIRIPGSDIERAVMHRGAGSGLETLSLHPTILLAAPEEEYPPAKCLAELAELGPIRGERPRFVIDEALPPDVREILTSYGEVDILLPTLTTLLPVLERLSPADTLICLGSYPFLKQIRRHIGSFMDQKSKER